MHAPQWFQKALSTFADWYVRNGFYRLQQAHSDWAASWSGEAVNENSALNLSTYFACKRIISEAVSFLPLDLKVEKNGEKRNATEHPTYRALHNAPNAEMTAMAFRETLTGHAVTGGMAYAQIFRRSGTKEAIEFWPIPPESVRIEHEPTGEKRLMYFIKDGNSAERKFTVDRNRPHDILCIPGLGHDGVRGYSVLECARQSLGTALAQERHVGRFFANGGRVPYLVEKALKFKDDKAAEEWREKWMAVYRDPHKPVAIEPGDKYHQIGISAKDSQLLESRLATPAEICRWFLISPIIIGDLSHATFSNVEHLYLQFYKMTLTSWLTRWEQNLWRCVLTPDEKAGGYFFKHNANALLRGDFLTRMQGYAIGLQNGFKNPNEVKALEDENRFDGGDDYHIQLNMQTLGDGNPTASQQAALTKIGTAKKGVYLQ